MKRYTRPIGLLPNAGKQWHGTTASYIAKFDELNGLKPTEMKYNDVDWHEFHIAKAETK